MEFVYQFIKQSNISNQNILDYFDKKYEDIRNKIKEISYKKEVITRKSF